MAELLEIHVAGNGIGESILLCLPNGKWGMIDAYVPTLNDPNSSSAFRLLLERGVRNLEFLCLTHPDTDHFRGMSLFLENFDVGQFWIFAAKSPAELYQRIAFLLKAKAARLQSTPEVVEDANDFAKTIKLVRRLRAAGKTERIFMQLGQPLYRIPATQSGSELRITALGPAGNLIDEYEDSIEKCFDTSVAARVLTVKAPDINNNIVSAALLIEYGDTTVVLGGDMEKEGWEHVIAYTTSTLSLDADFVKVSHHGSSNGYCDRLWEDHFCSSRSTTAVITAYSKKKLPREDDVDYIKAHAHKLFTTSHAALSFGAPPAHTRKSAFRRLSPQAVAALESIFVRAKRKDQRPQGICSFLVDDRGTCEHHLSGDAAEL
jgi:hypothetical protein